MLALQSAHSPRFKILVAASALFLIILLLHLTAQKDTWSIPGISLSPYKSHDDQKEDAPLTKEPAYDDDLPIFVPPPSLATVSSDYSTGVTPSEPAQDAPSPDFPSDVSSQEPSPDGESPPDNKNAPPESSPTTSPAVHVQSSQSLPANYLPVSLHNEWCENAYSTKYLYELASTPKQMCASGTSSLECFSVRPFERLDSFCVAKNVAVDQAGKKFLADCSMSDATKAEFQEFPEYMWWTGVRKMIDDWFLLSSNQKEDESTTATVKAATLQCKADDKRRSDRSTAVLFKREGSNPNMWHSLMEVYSYYQSMDALHLATDSSGEPYFDPSQDSKDFQVIWVDDRPRGLYAPLWNIFSSRPAIFLDDIDASRSCYDRVIIPLPGGANTMWAGDWEVRECTNSTMLDAFQRRVLSYLEVPEPAKDRPFTVTFIDRKQTRVLHDGHAFIDKLRKQYPNIHFQTFDLREGALADHLRIARETDLLVGTHGAGLTSTMFLPPRSSVVEVLPPGFMHKGFRNMANMMGHRYFSAHATLKEGDDPKEWQKAPFLYIEEERFMAMMDMAIASLRNSGRRNVDVV